MKCYNKVNLTKHYDKILYIITIKVFLNTGKYCILYKRTKQRGD
jgi:hypothetical protein